MLHDPPCLRLCIEAWFLIINSPDCRLVNFQALSMFSDLPMREGRARTAEMDSGWNCHLFDKKGCPADSESEVTVRCTYQTEGIAGVCGSLILTSTEFSMSRSQNNMSAWMGPSRWSSLEAAEKPTLLFRPVLGSLLVTIESMALGVSL